MVYSFLHSIAISWAPLGMHIALDMSGKVTAPKEFIIFPWHRRQLAKDRYIKQEDLKWKLEQGHIIVWLGQGEPWEKRCKLEVEQAQSLEADIFKE